MKFKLFSSLSKSMYSRTSDIFCKSGNFRDYNLKIIPKLNSVKFEISFIFFAFKIHVFKNLDIFCKSGNFHECNLKIIPRLNSGKFEISFIFLHCIQELQMCVVNKKIFALFIFVQPIVLLG